MARSYTHDFAIINKSYLADMKWSIVLYRSWLRCNPLNIPFLIIVPRRDLEEFFAHFDAELQAQRITSPPIILCEEDLLDSAGIEVPSEFDGWRTQQVIKLCFSKIGIARNYLTVDSSMIFTRDFRPHALFCDQQMCTAAEPVSKASFFGRLRSSGEKGWLDGEITNLADSLERICSFMGNDTLNTSSYISCTGMFDSDLSQGLEQYAHEKGLNGYIGLLSIAPYEFAWYGEYVYTQHPQQFKPHSPHIMTLVESELQADQVLAGMFKVHEWHLGLMFQPPAAHLLDPETVDVRAMSGCYN